MDAEYGVILATAPTKDIAEKLAEGLIEGRLAACVNIIPGLTSIYRWQDTVEKTEEFQLIIKTRLGLQREVAEFIRQNHPHDVPEVVCVPIWGGNDSYLDWIGANSIIPK